MNERYKELEKQCTKQQIDYDVGKMYDQVDHRKLAELIVQECVACATWVGKMNTTAVEPVHTAQAINQRIKKHFGVEE